MSEAPANGPRNGSGNGTGAGSIYDLGYRGYEGARLGRNHAILTLYLYSLRGAFGLGRRATAKIVPFALVILAFLPAVIQLGIGALVTDQISLITHVGYYEYVSIIIGLFCASVAPELVGKDQRTRTLSLYFSRALLRRDYAIAKFAAMTTALLFLTLVPQAVLYVGNGFATNDAWGYVRGEWDQAAPIIGSAILLSAFVASFSLAIAAQTSRRAYSTIAILAVFLLTVAVAATMAELTDRWIAAPAVLVSPFDIIYGFTRWMFRAELNPNETVAKLDFEGVTWFIVAVVWTVAAIAVLIRRYEGMRA